ncbi:hypothetical protein DFH11DRAFT_197729 [Phellopilus nigrolimitatus]|nr:hypothetical protein DFH11DRAFT_197729 [Phellopilus nigrolimitatus]
MSFDVPPSYESVVARFEQCLGTNPKPQEVLDVIEQLPQYEIDILASNAHGIPAMTDDQKVAFTLGVAKTISSPEAAQHLKYAAANASAACNAIETMFNVLLKELAKIDAKNMSEKKDAFVPRFELLSQEYRRTVHLSRDLAVKIAVYGQRFDTIIVPFCNDGSLTTTQRVAKITEFIKDAETFSKDSDAIMNSFNGLKDKFSEFIGSFSGWASNKEERDTKELEQVRKDLEELNEDISKLEIALIAVGAVAAASLPATAIAAAISGPFAVFVIIGGLALAGIATVSVIGLAIAIRSKKDDAKAKQERIDALVREINDVKATREKLELLGTKNLTLFNQNITVMALLWQSAHTDALKIKTWLEGGAKDADRPDYMMKSLDKAIRIYQAMAVYLFQYADGIASVDVPLVN